MYGGLTPCRNLRPYSCREHTVFINDNDENRKQKQKLSPWSKIAEPGLCGVMYIGAATNQSYKFLV